jgi:O-antigen ligase
MTADDWPRTTRILPWSFAVFLALLWLVPFNDIEHTDRLPIDLKLDRLLLPFVIAAWGLTLVVGTRGAVRFRMTWIHAAVAAFVLCAFFSVVFEARSLNRALELEGSVKQLPLLISYVSLFLIAATAIRPTEVRPFLSYTLLLAVICALGVIWEYRMEQNLFFEWSDKLLPSVFELPEFDATVIDNIGRRLVRGPAALPLEAVAMLAMALPIALVWLMQSRRWRDRILYGLAVCLLLAATLATYRKSALLAPVAVVVTVAWFRRSELLKLAPLALVLVVVVHIVAPGAIGRTGSQFDSLGVSTVSDRSADYDAVRPDLWSNLLFGRGWGSYSHEMYRILDSEILHRVLEMGVIGLLAYAFMILSVVIFARSAIASRDPRRAPLALVGAAAAMAFLVVSTLFDVLAFPHATYIFLYMAGLVAVVLQWETERPQPVAPHHEARVHAQNGAVRAPRRRGASAVP